MYVVFDPAAVQAVIHYSLDDGTAWQQFIYNGTEEGPLLSGLDSLLAFVHKRPSDIARLGVVVGQGTFTGTRVAVTVANTLAYVFGCPVLALPGFAAEQTTSILRQAQAGQYATALYSSAPRIGKVAV